LLRTQAPGAAGVVHLGAQGRQSIRPLLLVDVGQPVPWPPGVFFTARNVALPTPLAPHDSVRLSFDWHYEISKRANREGMIDSTTYYLAYFYPRVSVYDDYSGWDTFSFNDNLEFYNDFNDYDVAVTVPARYIVWGTGGLLNAAEVLQPEYAQRYNASLTSDQTIHVATSAELAAGGVTAQKASNTWRFRATNISDVTYAISDHFNWDAASVVVDTAAHRRVSVQAAYNDSAGVTAEFNRNVLNVINTNLDGDLEPERFEHVALYDEGAQWIEMRLQAREAHTARIEALDLDVPFELGEHIRTELSCKFTPDGLRHEYAQAGLELLGWYTDPEELFALSLTGPA